MSGPQREWFIGDKGPSAWTNREQHPRASNNVPMARAVDVPRLKLVAHSCGDPSCTLCGRIAPACTSQGRDPFDTVTMELPGIEPPDSPLLVAASIAHDDGDDTSMWRLLWEWARKDQP